MGSLTEYQRMCLRFLGIDLDRVLDYLGDPDSYHDQAVDVEDGMP